MDTNRICITCFVGKRKLSAYTCVPVYLKLFASCSFSVRAFVLSLLNFIHVHYVASSIQMIRSINDKIVLVRSFIVYLTPSITYEFVLFSLSFCFFLHFFFAFHSHWIRICADLVQWQRQAHSSMVSFYSFVQHKWASWIYFPLIYLFVCVFTTAFQLRTLCHSQ